MEENKLDNKKFIKADESVRFLLDIEAGAVLPCADSPVCQVKLGNKVYTVDEDTFEAVRDYNLIASLPSWMLDINADRVAADIDSYYLKVIAPQVDHLEKTMETNFLRICAAHGITPYTCRFMQQIMDTESGQTWKDHVIIDNIRQILDEIRTENAPLQRAYDELMHEFQVMALAMMGDNARAVQKTIADALDDARFNLRKEADGTILTLMLHCKVNGREMLAKPVEKADRDLFNELPYDRRPDFVTELAAKYFRDEIFPAGRTKSAARGR